PWRAGATRAPAPRDQRGRRRDARGDAQRRPRPRGARAPPSAHDIRRRAAAAARGPARPRRVDPGGVLDREGAEPARTLGGGYDPAVLSPRAAAVQDALHAAGVDAEVRTFDETVPTAVAAAAVLGCEVGAIANSLVFDVEGEPLLVLASGGHRVDTAKVADLLDCAPIRRAAPEFVLEHTGQEIGGGGARPRPA